MFVVQVRPSGPGAWSAGSFGDVVGPVAGSEAGPVGGVVVGDADEFGQDGCGYVAGELEQGGLAILVGLDADRDELGPDVLSGEVAAGVAPGNSQPVSREA